MVKKKKSLFKILAVITFVFLLCIYGYRGLNFVDSENQNLIDYSEDDNSSVVNNTVAVNNNKVVNKSTQPVIVIDAGHGDFDTGAVGFNKTKEKDVTLPVALDLGAILQKNGMKVIYTRTSDKVKLPRNEKANLSARTQISNSNNASLFVSIHANSSIFKFVSGVETYYGGSSNSKKLAGFIENQIVKSNKLSNRGIKTANYYVLKNTKAPSVLIELGFITNAKDESIMKNANSQQMLAASIANGILQYYKK